MSEGERERGAGGPGTAAVASSDAHGDGSARPRGDRREGPVRDDAAGAPPPGFARELREVARDHRGASVVAGLLLLLLLAAAVAGVGLAVLAYRREGRALRAEREAVEKEKKAEEVADEYKGRYRQSEATWKAAARELRQARASAEAARRSEEGSKAIVDFIKRRLLAAGRPGDGSLSAAFWAGGKGRDVTMRQALDATASHVATAFADRPLAEAALREMLGLGYLNIGEPSLAVRQYERALELREAAQGPADPEAADCRNQLAVAYRLVGRTTEAALLFDRPPVSPAHAAALAARAMVLLREKKAAEAEVKLRESLAIRRKVQPDDWTTFDTESTLGEALLDQEKYDEAEKRLVAGARGLQQHADAIPSEDRSRLSRAIERLVRLYESRGRAGEAETWLKQLDAARASDRP